MSLQHLWAGWRSEYVTTAAAPSDRGAADDTGSCVLCRITAPDAPTLWRGAYTAGVLNAYPYTSGHLMVAPLRHVADLEDLTADEAAELWQTVTDAVVALKAAYTPEGVNFGANLGRAAGAGVPGHAHVHVLPRWNGDTNFMTTVAGVRVMPETMEATFSKLSAAWPRPLP